MRILVVDDFKPFCRFVSALLQREPGGHVVFEAADGVEAVKKAKELTPDLIIMDIGLPKLSGFEAARHIREDAPDSRILFVSVHDSLEYVEEAIETGACGYVNKVDAGKELETAVSDVLQGRWFVSDRIKARLPVRPSHAHTLACFGRTGVCRLTPAPPTPRRVEVAYRHEAQLYSDESGFLDSLTYFLEGALKAGKTALVVATEAHRNGVLPRLIERGLDITAAMRQARYIALDAEEALATIMAGGLPDRGRFLEVMSYLMASATNAPVGPPTGFAIYGECAPLLWAQGEPEAAIRIEQICNEIVEEYGATILCGYPLNRFDGERARDILKRICEEHSAVFSV